MNEIRFNNPNSNLNSNSNNMNNENQSMPNPSAAPETYKKGSNKLLKIIIAIVIIGAIVYLALYTNVASMFKSSAVINGNAYSAVFLQNGQVYFGKITKNTDKEIILKEVYYLQVDGTAQSPDSAAAAQARFNLVQLGNELHGPTDELYINKAQVTFYEYLRDDSQVVATINSQKKK